MSHPSHYRTPTLVKAYNWLKSKRATGIAAATAANYQFPVYERTKWDWLDQGTASLPYYARRAVRTYRSMNRYGRRPYKRRRAFQRRGFKQYNRMTSAMRGRYQTRGFYGRYNGYNRRSGLQESTGRELKFKDWVITPTSRATGSPAGQIPAFWQRITNTANDEFKDLNRIEAGTDQNTRIGRLCTIKSIHMKGLVRLLAATTCVCFGLFLLLFCLSL